MQKDVTCLYRRNRENMPGSMREVFHAEEEGINFSWLSLPTKFKGVNSHLDIDVAESCFRKTRFFWSYDSKNFIK